MTGATTAKTLMTADEFLAFWERPENENKLFELVRGEIVRVPPPYKKHGIVASIIARQLWDYVFATGYGHVTGNDSGVLLERDPDTVRGPDVVYYPDESIFDDVNPKWAEVPPVLAVEVVSPSDCIGIVMRKIAEYLTNGVRVVWLVDYEEKNLTLYRPNRNPEIYIGDQFVLGGEEIPGLRCRLGDFFRLPGDAPAPSEPSAPS